MLRRRLKSGEKWILHRGIVNDFQMMNNKLKKCMSLKKKLATALKTLKTGLKNPELDEAFKLLESALKALPEEEPALSSENLPAPKIGPKDIALYSDGACRGNPGPGSWAFVAQNCVGDILQKASGVSELTTNNKMELQGAIEGLSFLEEHAQKFDKVFFYTDSRYVVDGITSWVKGWKARGWKKADKKEPENLEQWKRLDELYAQYDVKFIWVKGHAGHPQNELCDRMANEALDVQGF